METRSQPFTRHCWRSLLISGRWWQTQLRMYQSVSSGTVARNVSALVKEFESHFARGLSPQLWTSVYDNATFVLSNNVSRAGKREAEASQRLLDMLASLTGRGPTPGRRPSNQLPSAFRPTGCEPAQALMRISEKRRESPAMALNVITPGWRKVGASRSAGPAAPAGLQGLRADFVPEGAEIEEAVIEPTPPARGRAAAPRIATATVTSRSTGSGIDGASGRPAASSNATWSTGICSRRGGTVGMVGGVLRTATRSPVRIGPSGPLATRTRYIRYSIVPVSRSTETACTRIRA